MPLTARERNRLMKAGRTRPQPLSPDMIEALHKLSDGDMRHGAHCLPGRNPWARNRPLSALKDRGLIAQIRQPYAWGSPKDVYWIITEAGRAALATARGETN